jgi:hypothetical protein
MNATATGGIRGNPSGKDLSDARTQPRPTPDLEKNWRLSPPLVVVWVVVGSFEPAARRATLPLGSSHDGPWHLGDDPDHEPYGVSASLFGVTLLCRSGRPIKQDWGLIFLGFLMGQECPRHVHDRRQADRRAGADAAERGREAAERQREQGELDRRKSEEGRHISETLRERREQFRDHEEETRGVSEHLRDAQETGRELAEQAREMSELLRRAAEDASVDARATLTELKDLAQRQRVVLEVNRGHSMRWRDGSATWRLGPDSLRDLE